MLVCNVVFGICVKICCHLRKGSYGMKICSVVCHDNSGRNLNSCGMRNYVGNVCGMTAPMGVMMAATPISMAM